MCESSLSRSFDGATNFPLPEEPAMHPAIYATIITELDAERRASTRSVRSTGGRRGSRVVAALRARRAGRRSAAAPAAGHVPVTAGR
jgi:hypothetical protein